MQFVGLRPPKGVSSRQIRRGYTLARQIGVFAQIIQAVTPDRRRCLPMLELHELRWLWLSPRSPGDEFWAAAALIRLTATRNIPETLAAAPHSGPERGSAISTMQVVGRSQDRSGDA